MTVLVCVPTWEEFSRLRPDEPDLARLDGTPVMWEKWGEVGVLFAVTGVGADASAANAGSLVDLIGPRSVWLLGTAGALDPRLEVGDIVVCRRIGRAGEEDLYIDVPPDGWAGRSLTEGSAVTVDRGVTAARERQRLFGLGFSVVEMEGYDVARAVRAAGVPFAMIRAISDCPGLSRWEQGIAPAMTRLAGLIPAVASCSHLQPARD